MSEEKRYLLRKTSGDQPAGSEQEIKEALARGHCKPADLLFDFSTRAWSRVGEHPSFQSVMGAKPGPAPEKRLVYYMGTGNLPMLQGPFTTKEIHGRIHARELCLNSWVFVEGDKEWRQIRAVKVLADMMPALPTDVPASEAETPPPIAPASAPAANAPAPSGMASFPGVAAESPSLINLTFEDDAPAAPPPKPAAPPPAPAPAFAPAPMFTPAPVNAAPELVEDDFPEREEATMAISALGLSLQTEMGDIPPAAPIAAPIVPPVPSAPSAPPKFAPIPTPSAAPVAPPPPPAARTSAPPPPPSAPPRAPGASGSDEGFDGITAEIPMDPIWLVKPGNSETVSGPFRFLEIIKYLEEGRLTKNDKISKTGTNRFVKIAQQYEFNVKHTVESVIEQGVEKQKILIKRRHPRVAYMTGVQLLSRHGPLTGNCINISAGGILLEMSKAELALGEILEIKLLPGLIPQAIACKALVIGKIPKMPPGFALKFEDLKNEDKEAIEFFVQETLKREL